MGWAEQVYSTISGTLIQENDLLEFMKISENSLAMMGLYL